MLNTKLIIWAIITILSMVSIYSIYRYVVDPREKLAEIASKVDSRKELVEYINRNNEREAYEITNTINDYNITTSNWVW